MHNSTNAKSRSRTGTSSKFSFEEQGKSLPTKIDQKTKQHNTQMLVKCGIRSERVAPTNYKTPPIIKQIDPKDSKSDFKSTKDALHKALAKAVGITLDNASPEVKEKYNDINLNKNIRLASKRFQKALKYNTNHNLQDMYFDNFNEVVGLVITLEKYADQRLREVEKGSTDYKELTIFLQRLHGYKENNHLAKTEALNNILKQKGSKSASTNSGSITVHWKGIKAQCNAKLAEHKDHVTDIANFALEIRELELKLRIAATQEKPAINDPDNTLTPTFNHDPVLVDIAGVTDTIPAHIPKIDDVVNLVGKMQRRSNELRDMLQKDKSFAFNAYREKINRNTGLFQTNYQNSNLTKRIDHLEKTLALLEHQISDLQSMLRGLKYCIDKENNVVYTTKFYQKDVNEILNKVYLIEKTLNKGVQHIKRNDNEYLVSEEDLSKVIKEEKGKNPINESKIIATFEKYCLYADLCSPKNADAKIQKYIDLITKNYPIQQLGQKLQDLRDLDTLYRNINQTSFKIDANKLKKNGVDEIVRKYNENKHFWSTMSDDDKETYKSVRLSALNKMKDIESSLYGALRYSTLNFNNDGSPANIDSPIFLRENVDAWKNLDKDNKKIALSLMKIYRNLSVTEPLTQLRTELSKWEDTYKLSKENIETINKRYFNDYIPSLQSLIAGEMPQSMWKQTIKHHVSITEKFINRIPINTLQVTDDRIKTICDLHGSYGEYLIGLFKSENNTKKKESIILDIKHHIDAVDKLIRTIPNIKLSNENIASIKALHQTYSDCLIYLKKLNDSVKITKNTPNKVKIGENKKAEEKRINDAKAHHKLIKTKFSSFIQDPNNIVVSKASTIEPINELSFEKSGSFSLNLSNTIPDNKIQDPIIIPLSGNSSEPIGNIPTTVVNPFEGLSIDDLSTAILGAIEIFSNPESTLKNKAVSRAEIIEFYKIFVDYKLAFNWSQDEEAKILGIEVKIKDAVLKLKDKSLSTIINSLTSLAVGTVKLKSSLMKAGENGPDIEFIENELSNLNNILSKLKTLSENSLQDSEAILNATASYSNELLNVQVFIYVRKEIDGIFDVLRNDTHPYIETIQCYANYTKNLLVRALNSDMPDDVKAKILDEDDKLHSFLKIHSPKLSDEMNLIKILYTINFDLEKTQEDGSHTFTKEEMRNILKKNKPSDETSFTNFTTGLYDHVLKLIREDREEIPQQKSSTIPVTESSSKSIGNIPTTVVDSSELEILIWENMRSSISQNIDQYNDHSFSGDRKEIGDTIIDLYKYLVGKFKTIVINKWNDYQEQDIEIIAKKLESIFEKLPVNIKNDVLKNIDSDRNDVLCLIKVHSAVDKLISLAEDGTTSYEDLISQYSDFVNRVLVPNYKIASGDTPEKIMDITFQLFDVIENKYPDKTPSVEMGLLIQLHTIKSNLTQEDSISSLTKDLWKNAGVQFSNFDFSTSTITDGLYYEIIDLYQEKENPSESTVQILKNIERDISGAILDYNNTNSPEAKSKIIKLFINLIDVTSKEIDKGEPKDLAEILSIEENINNIIGSCTGSLRHLKDLPWMVRATIRLKSLAYDWENQYKPTINGEFLSLENSFRIFHNIDIDIQNAVNPYIIDFINIRLLILAHRKVDIINSLAEKGRNSYTDIINEYASFSKDILIPILKNAPEEIKNKTMRLDNMLTDSIKDNLDVDVSNELTFISSLYSIQNALEEKSNISTDTESDWENVKENFPEELISSFATFTQELHKSVSDLYKKIELSVNKPSDSPTKTIPLQDPITIPAIQISPPPVLGNNQILEEDKLDSALSKLNTETSALYKTIVAATKAATKESLIDINSITINYIEYRQNLSRLQKSNANDELKQKWESEKKNLFSILYSKGSSEFTDEINYIDQLLADEKRIDSLNKKLSSIKNSTDVDKIKKIKDKLNSGRLARAKRKVKTSNAAIKLSEQLISRCGDILDQYKAIKFEKKDRNTDLTNSTVRVPRNNTKPRTPLLTKSKGDTSRSVTSTNPKPNNPDKFNTQKDIGIEEIDDLIKVLEPMVESPKKKLLPAIPVTGKKPQSALPTNRSPKNTRNKKLPLPPNATNVSSNNKRQLAEINVELPLQMMQKIQASVAVEAVEAVKKLSTIKAEPVKPSSKEEIAQQELEEAMKNLPET